MKTEEKEIARVAYEAYTRAKFPGWTEAEIWSAEGIAEQEGWRAAARAVLNESRDRDLPNAWLMTADAIAAYALAALCALAGFRTAAWVILILTPAAMAAMGLLKPVWILWRASRRGDK